MTTDSDMEATLRTVHEEPTPHQLPPPAFFLRSVPITPTSRWIRDKATSQGPFVAGLVLAMAAGAGMALGLSPSCELTGPLPGGFGSEPRLPDHTGSGLPYVVQWKPMPPALPSGNH
ncbi:hypothetical protein AB0O34_08555 [Sphaerisporangium sp. NPDC088356]|uniref:hypothetical protein n=1 Tax=Sphaerisporangium sp. NPDC088356 TaxID=3154871 RepID=UPI00344A7018